MQNKKNNLESDQDHQRSEMWAWAIADGQQAQLDQAEDALYIQGTDHKGNKFLQRVALTPINDDDQ